MSLGNLPDAVDLAHHLSDVAKARKTSPLKGLQKYFGKEGIISLAGGLPSPDYFPYESISAQVLLSDTYSPDSSGASANTKGPISWIWRLFSSETRRTTELSVPKYPEHPSDVNLSTSLQYGMASGIPQLQKILKEFTSKVYKPAYANYTTLLHTGNTDGWFKVVITLCDPGQGVLASEWTYPSAMSTIIPYGIQPIPISMDSQGMRSDVLRKVLSEWDEKSRGMPRPHVMYTVPVGQNPTGTTMELQRKKEIYNICVDFDIIIVEDDPYYFLQEGNYIPPHQRNCEKGLKDDDDESFLAGLAPSYLKIDYQGRVIRLDSFSKTIAPGCRMGWFTCNPLFAERLERQGETSTQGPSGFGQSLVASLLLKWQYSGYIRWLKGIRAQYTSRRDFFIDTLSEEFELTKIVVTSGVWEGCDALVAFQKGRGEKHSTSMFSFVPPTSGMFIWLKLHFENHPLFKSHGHKSLETQLWIALAEAGVLFGPGSMFAAKSSSDDTEGPGHFRISFSNVEYLLMKKAISIFARVITQFFRKKQ